MSQGSSAPFASGATVKYAVLRSHRHQSVLAFVIPAKYRDKDYMDSEKSTIRAKFTMCAQKKMKSKPRKIGVKNEVNRAKYCEK